MASSRAPKALCEREVLRGWGRATPFSMVAREGVLEEVAFELRLDDRAPAMGRGQQPERPVQVPRGGKKPGLEFSKPPDGQSQMGEGLRGARRKGGEGIGRFWVWRLHLAFFGICGTKTNNQKKNKNKKQKTTKPYHSEDA